MGKVNFLACLILVLLLSTSFKKEPSALFSQKFNILFTEVNNPIKIRHPNIACEKLLLVMEPESSAIVKKTGCGEFDISNLKRSPHGVKLKVYRNKVIRRNLLSIQTFRTLKRPTERATLGGMTSSRIEKSQLVKIKELKVEFPNIKLSDTPIEILEYSYMFTSLNGSSIKGVVKNTAKLPKELRSAFSTAQHGDQVKIYGIKAFSEYGGEVLIDEDLDFVVI